MASYIGPVGAATSGGMLMGRLSYEDMLGHWNKAGGAFKDALNAAPKFVASSNPGTRLEWPNSTLLHGDVPARVKELKRVLDGDLLIMGSGSLIHSLLPHNLIDEFRLLIYPVVVGGGVRLFPDDGQKHALDLLYSKPTSKGVILATYRPA
jgi:dihydrofolate reductase